MRILFASVYRNFVHSSIRWLTLLFTLWPLLRIVCVYTYNECIYPCGEPLIYWFRSIAEAQRVWGGGSVMERFIPPEFDLPQKGRSVEAQKRWRETVGKLVKNRRRRFRYAADLEKRSEAKEHIKRLRVRTVIFCVLSFSFLICKRRN